MFTKGQPISPRLQCLAYTATSAGEKSGLKTFISNRLLKIRPYTEDDYPAVLAIYAASKLDELRYEEAGFVLLPLEKDARRLGQLLESTIHICEDDGIIGYCAQYGSEIRALFVHPRSRGKGVGRRLLEFLLARIPGPAHLYVARSNSPAKNLYMQYDFEVVEEFETSYNGVPVFANKMVRQDRNEQERRANCPSFL